MDIVPRAATGSALGGLASAGHGADPNELRFAERELTIDDLPQGFKGGGLVLASQAPQPSAPATRHAFVARTEAKPRRRDGKVVQRRVGFDVTADGLSALVVDRELTKHGAAYKPSGEWELARRSTWSARPVHSKGRAKLDAITPERNTSATPAADPYAGEAATFEAGATALQYLPASVRRSVYARVSTPSHFDGKVVRYDDGSIGVVVVRGDGGSAVAVNATLAEGSDTWDIDLMTFDARRTDELA